ncbi:dTDP-4-dehydrorhamnose reductase [Shewanella sp. 3B26]|uniref:dTDP-4-dehydrorhamnose reductase n=1 Tax=Shewanella zhuhaiensis TaxID=2919576 RepID=A0AAJ1FA99_9GAMM|nr:dTDP-4-dehydrorhamnose reductase [Shewanella zhuhaiensis]MCH4293900.1 dTDP-4-dehydrorhamnose reductase [Shewanella zhuhaiensis]
MKVAIFGATGQVGRALKACKPSTCQLLTPTKAEVDFLRPESLFGYIKDHKPALIINCAAYTAVDKAESEQAICRVINADACGHLARAAAEINAAIIHLSTDYVFDGHLSRPYREDDEPAPLSVYGQSKWQGEQLIAAHAERHLIVRTSWIFDGQGKNFVNTMLSLAAIKPELRIVSDQLGAPTPASSLALAIWQLALRAQQSDCPWGTYHFSGAPFISWYGFAKAIFSEAQRLGVIKPSPALIPISAAEFGAAALRPANSRLDCAKIDATFAIKSADWRLALTGMLESKARQAE